MAKSEQIDSRSISVAADDVSRHRITANRTLRPQWTNSTTADDSLPLSDGGEKSIRFFSLSGDFDQWPDGVEGIGHPREG